MKAERSAGDTEYLVDKAIAQVGGQKVWSSLTPGAKDLILHDLLCPAGGTPEYEYHDDGPRYFERKSKH